MTNKEVTGDKMAQVCKNRSLTVREGRKLLNTLLSGSILSPV